jgi:hypothetical protein
MKKKENVVYISNHQSTGKNITGTGYVVRRSCKAEGPFASSFSLEENHMNFLKST